MRQQGIGGPPPKFLVGNIIEIKRSRQDAERAAVAHPHPPVFHNTPAVFPFLEQWREQYGPLYMFSLGKMQVLCVNTPDLVKEITTCTSLDFGRPSYQQKDLGPLLGQGILTSNGHFWARQRKIMAPELFMDKVKGMASMIRDSAMSLVDSWKHETEACEGGILDIAIDDHMKKFSGEVISRACFGSSYSKGQQIFLKFDSLQKLMSNKTLSTAGIPGLRYLPTKTNKQMWALEREIGALILKVVKQKQEAGTYEKDLLQSLLEGARSSYTTSAAIDRFIVDNCRNIYLAGFETSAVSASWCLMLLASNPEWQTRVRLEVHQVSQGRVPDLDMLRKMKQLHMVIQETMRLYPPTPTLSRETFKDMKIGHLTVPKGVNVWTMVATLHTDTTIWGPDALEFKPQRFENGIAGACASPSSYMPFGFGQRVCLGQHLAMVELKLLISLLLSNFSFELSPDYVHSPVMRMMIEPKHGVRLLVRKV
ncbi:Cytochrome P450 714A1 [Striga hermonthica]|uniref:Cytochrome P450 714A1 n=1 Tax=Striga hermonthica TaxID=68872 RepID=A0A9N7NMK9_STRHE|nr:Cytochrome P450 714A1 [Striga hermonthica]